MTASIAWRNLKNPAWRIFNVLKFRSERNGYMVENAINCRTKEDGQ